MKNQLTVFRVVWIFNALVTAASALIYWWMFVGGGSGPHNDAHWKWAFAFAAIALWGSKNLMAQNRKRFAWLLLASLAIPCLLLLVFIIVLANSDLHWQ